MCFAAAYDMTGDERYGAQYRRYRGEASERSRPIRYESLWHLYAALQMQFSVRLLYDVDADAPYHARYEQLLAGAAAYCRAYVLENAPKLCAGDLTRYNYVYEPWRDLPLQPIPHMGDPACLKPVRNEANSAFYPLRDFGNAVHTLCLCDGAADGAVRVCAACGDERDRLRRALLRRAARPAGRLLRAGTGAAGARRYAIKHFAMKRRRNLPRLFCNSGTRRRTKSC